ncbi:uncharacterized protein MELLADRAFT_107266 [Melampsora larici-populina 98AG31]|uniref:Uncharacterized protein n=1 Tax=Melampsora larici-populina (strain 98AG31 / pathotype 3-4-7) TaxID=747676 RepID=F4RPD7_MELLP|nr:uncharacterized protein MELLADRAFT_107266 [Melampsora larici-populina 98AG31]EGG05867.1 hypothetical protein MELLADRAFT_107266 [Melampsora larici-populina 98AG31]
MSNQQQRDHSIDPRASLTSEVVSEVVQYPDPPNPSFPYPPIQPHAFHSNAPPPNHFNHHNNFNQPVYWYPPPPPPGLSYATAPMFPNTSIAGSFSMTPYSQHPHVYPQATEGVSCTPIPPTPAPSTKSSATNTTTTSIPTDTIISPVSTQTTAVNPSATTPATHLPTT